MSPDLVIKANCPQCGKKKAIRHQVWLGNGSAHVQTKGKGCYKCGYCPEPITLK